MKKIPFWEPKPKTLLLAEDHPSSHSFSLPPLPAHHANPALTNQLSPIYIDHNIQVYSYSNNYENNNINSNEMDIVQVQTIQMSIVHDKLNSKIIKLSYAIFMCINVGKLYMFVVPDQASRYSIITAHQEQLNKVLIQYQNKQYTAQNNKNSKVNTQLKPLIKYDSVFAISDRGMYVAGSKPLYQWEITSPIWIYLFNQNIWKQIQYRANNINNMANNVSSKSKSKNKSKSKIIEQKVPQKQKSKIKHSKKQWIIPLQQTIVIIKNNSISAKMINYLKQQIQLNSNIPIIMNGQQKVLHENIIKTQCDSFIYTYYMNSQGYSSVLILVKTNTAQRMPILLQISLMEIQMYKQTKLKISNSNNNNYNSNFSYQICISRLDLGIFLSTNPVTNLPNKLWDIVNQVTYMQVTESLSSSSNFSKKNSLQSQIMNLANTNSTQSNKNNKNKNNLILNIYCKNNKNNNANYSYSNSPANLRMTVYNIKINLLQQIQLNDQNISLAKYYQFKQYSDMVIKAQTHQILCSKQLFQFHSPKFKKLFASTTNNSTKNDGLTTVKLQHTKFTTAYFLVQQLYHQFGIPLKTIDQATLFDIMVLAQKFQITPLQILCEQQTKFDAENFPKLYGYFRNSQTTKFRQQLLKCFIMNPHAIIKNMPIGKVQQLIRLVYSPQCAHTNLTEIKAKLQNTYSLKDPQTGQTKQVNKCINYAGIIKGQQMILKICLKCNRLLGFNHQSHRKNKSSVRGNSVGSFGHKKKDNNSN